MKTYTKWFNFRTNEVEMKIIREQASKNSLPVSMYIKELIREDVNKLNNLDDNK